MYQAPKRKKEGGGRRRGMGEKRRGGERERGWERERERDDRKAMKRNGSGKTDGNKEARDTNRLLTTYE